MGEPRPTHLNTVARRIVQGEISDASPSFALNRTIAETRSSIVAPQEGEKRGINGILSSLAWGYGNLDMARTQSLRTFPEQINHLFFNSTESVVDEMARDFSREARKCLEEINKLPDTDMRKRILRRASQFLPFQGLPVSPIPTIVVSLESNFREALHYYKAIFPLAASLLRKADENPTVNDCLAIARDSFTLINGYTGLDDKVFDEHKKLVAKKEGDEVTFIPEFFELQGTKIVDLSMPAPLDPHEPHNPDRIAPQCGGKVSSAIIVSLFENKPSWPNMVQSSYATFVNRVELKYAS